MERSLKMGRPLAAITGIIAWAAVVTQLALNLSVSKAGTAEALIRFFSYFTILTNILVAACCTMIMIKPAGSSFTSVKSITAVAVYISIVAIVYHLLLRNVWDPQGLQKWLDQGLHTVVPVLFVFYWFVFIPKQTLRWNDALPWLIYPFPYCCFILLRGAVSQYYPYPFMNVVEHGYAKVALNSLCICAGFLAISFLFIWVGKLRATKNL